MLTVKNIDVDKLNLKIQSEIAGELRRYKLMKSIFTQDDVVNSPTTF